MHQPELEPVSADRDDDGAEPLAPPPPVQENGPPARRARRTATTKAATAGPETNGLAATDELPPLLPELYINRELSWVQFNRRVLEEAADRQTPLLERVKFIAIFSANLDEFFMIRVAGVKRKVVAGIADPGPDGRTPSQQQSALRRAIQESLDDRSVILREDIIPALAAQGIAIVPYAELDRGERAVVAEFFEREIFPVLTPQAIDRGRRFPHVSNQSLNLIVSLRWGNDMRLARVKIPAVLPRFVPIPVSPPPAGQNGVDQPAAPLRFTWLEQVVTAHLPRLFPGGDDFTAYPFHVVRDYDIDMDNDEEPDDTHSLMDTMREQLSQRPFGHVVYLVVDTSMPTEVRDWLVEQLHATEQDLYVVDAPLALESFFELARLDRPDLKDLPFVPAPLTIGNGWPAHSPDDEAPADIFAALRERDILVHHPYQTFDAVADFVRAASNDRNVVAIKQTLYRIGKDSPLIPALINARDDDTQVAVLVELKARFDEENNMTWAQQLEQHGVHVAYGLGGLKTHCKATLIVRREADGLRRYVHLATGNYNATTARIYEDIGLLTARDDLGSDVSELFNVLTGFANQDRYRKLWVAPNQLRQRFLTAINREIASHRRIGNGHLIFKMNSLVDRQIIRALYAASRAGVKIDLIIRGVCCLRPGVPGWSETIRVISLVGRFLEHSRIYYFRNGGRGRDQLYMGSADLMERNLDRRVETVFPVEDPKLAAHIRDVILPAYLRDTVNARQLQPDGAYTRILPAPGEAPFDVQTWLLQLY